MFRASLALLAIAVPALAQTAAPLTLEEAIRESLDHNLDLLASRFDIPVAEARLITARLRPNPVVSISADHLTQGNPNVLNPSGPPEFSYRTDFILERGSKREARIAVAENDRAIARLNVAAAMRTVILNTQNAFLDMQLAKENLQLAVDNQKALQSIVDVNQARVRAGDLAPVELSRSQIAALQFQNAVQQARLRLQDARNKLQLLLGRMNPSPDFDISGDFRRDVVTGTPDTLVQSALEHRPDMTALRTSQARSQADIRLQIAQGRVDYTIGSEYRRQQGIAGLGNTVGVFFSAPLPVFNKNQGEIERARRETDQAGARIRALEATIRNDVMSAWQHFQSSQTLLQTVENNMLEQARNVRKTTEYSYRRGEATLVELLDAERAFNETMQTWNEARTEYARSLYTLESLAGLGVTEARP